MYQKALLQANLNPTQAEILECLYGRADGKASEIAAIIGKSRTIVYKELEELRGLGLAQKKERPNQPTVFLAEHPSALAKIIEKRERELKKDKELIESYLPDLISEYNLSHNRPGIRFYEGEQGAEIVAKDSLSADGIIYSYLDTESLMKNFAGFVDLYTKERLNKKIVKKIIAADNAYSRDYMLKHGEENFQESDLTQIKLLDDTFRTFHTIVQVYNNKISYTNYTGDDSVISVIIEDQNIASLNKQIFEFAWAKAKTLKQLMADGNR